MEDSSSARVTVNIRQEQQSSTKTVSLSQVVSPFKVLDEDAVAESLDLDRVAREEGLKEQPATGDTERSAFEQRIGGRFVEAISDYNQLLEAGLGQKTLEIKRLADTVRKCVEDARNVPSYFDIEKNQVGDRYGTLFEKNRAELVIAESEYQRFRKEHGITRTAEPPKSTLAWIFWIVMFAFLICVETFGNAGLFATNMDGGYLAGAVTALLFSLINAAAGGLVGSVVVPWLHVKRWRWGAALGVAGWFVALVAYALVVGHYRDCLQGEIEGATVQALVNFMESPFHLADLYSWILFGLTLLIGVGAAFEGYHIRPDPYPGYAKVSSRRDAALQEWDANTEGRQKFIRDTYDGMKKDFDEKSGTADVAVREILRCMEDKKQLVTQYVSAVAQAKATVKSLVRRFRDINARERTTKCPAYFATVEDIEFPGVRTDFGREADEATLSECKALVEGLQADSRKINDQMLEKFRELQDAWTKQSVNQSSGLGR